MEIVDLIKGLKEAKVKPLMYEASCVMSIEGFCARTLARKCAEKPEKDGRIPCPSVTCTFALDCERRITCHPVYSKNGERLNSMIDSLVKELEERSKDNE